MNFSSPFFPILFEMSNYDSESDFDDDVDIVGTSGGNDIVDVTGLGCPICFEDFKDNQDIVLFGCERPHYLCKPCAVRFNEGDSCHYCRTLVTAVHVFKGKFFDKGEGTAEDPIVIS